MPAGTADIIGIFHITRMADRPETFGRHHVGKADDGIERRADFMADARQEIGLVGIGGFRRPLGVAQFFFGALPLGNVANHGAIAMRGF